MKRIIIVSLIIFFWGSSLYSQQQVLLKTINKEYDGKLKKGKAHGNGIAKGIDTYVGNFKKGFPHGKGKYTWANGDVYDGLWEKGKKSGEGVLAIKRMNKPDSIVKGYWKKDEYLGLYKQAYKTIDKSTNMSAVSIREDKKKKNIYSIRFYAKVDQNRVVNPDFRFSVHHGQYREILNNSDYVELTNVEFPIKLKTYHGNHYLEFEIFKPGLWDVRMEVTRIQGLN